MNDSVTMVLSLLCGVALFLFGMSCMSDGLKKVAGNKMEMILYRLTNSPLKGFILGCGVTCVIQSSSAATVMVVGFVNSGMMKVEQAIGVILGANIGTSITGWIVCLSFIEGAGWVSYFSSATITAVVAIIGMVLKMFAKKDSWIHTGNILLGFAVLMSGMSMMSSAVAPLKTNPAFISAMSSLNNPVVALLFGIAAAAILQSSSAAVGVVQSLAVTGSLTFKAAFPLIMGISIGAGFPVIIAAMGASKDGKRTAYVYVLVAVIAAILGFAVYYPLDYSGLFTLDAMVMDPFSTALCNTLFRAITMTLMLPFTSLIKKCVYLIVPLDPAEEEDKGDFEKLDPRLLANPDMAFAAAEDVMNGMARKARKNVDRSINLLNSFTPEGFKKVQDLESTLNKYEEKLGKYLVKLTAAGVSYKQSKSVSKSLQAMADFEAIGDYALSVAEYAKTMSESKQKFSVEALDELNVIAASAEEAVNITVDAFISESSEDVNCVFALRELVSINGSQIKERHVKRLQSGDCSMELGFMQNDIIAAFQHIVDHCSAIALDIAKDSQKDFSIHRYLRRYQREIAPEYKEILEHYETKYAISNMAGSTISAEDIESVAPQGKMQTV